MYLNALFLVLSTVSAGAETVAGLARLVDGDTIEIIGERVRLSGIDAPEVGQRCRTSQGLSYSCGEQSSDALRDLISGHVVSCRGEMRDAYGRLIAQCHANGKDVNREMVRLGWAVAFRKFSQIYLDEELEATKANRGLWRGQFERPDAFRKTTWKDAQQESPTGCPIKGNISARGRIYHTPWSRHYRRTRINMSRGERWFCSEAEALAAGWRAPAR